MIETSYRSHLPWDVCVYIEDVSSCYLHLITISLSTIPSFVYLLFTNWNSTKKKRRKKRKERTSVIHHSVYIPHTLKPCCWVDNICVLYIRKKKREREAIELLATSLYFQLPVNVISYLTKNWWQWGWKLLASASSHIPVSFLHRDKLFWCFFFFNNKRITSCIEF